MTKTQSRPTSELLTADVGAWNKYRAEHPDWKPDLCATYLREADLRGANLYAADLYGADMRGADLREADLRGAHISEANLRGAIVSDANALLTALGIKVQA